MNESQPFDLRRRIRELQAIPERDRTDAEWDELNELEIRTAPGNRESDRPSDRPLEKGSGARGLLGQGRRQDRNAAKSGNPRPEGRQPGEGGGGRSLKRQHRRPKRPAENPGNS